LVAEGVGAGAAAEQGDANIKKRVLNRSHA